MPSPNASAARPGSKSSTPASPTNSEPARRPGAWRLILGDGSGPGAGPLRGAVNMAIDEALLRAVQAGAPPVLRLYQWSPACLSFGRNQLARGLYDPDRARAQGIDIVRRPTGGLAVLHQHELTYAIAAPADLLGGPRAAYVTINRALVAGLARIGVDAALAGDHATSPRPHSLNPCFQDPAAGEVIAGGAKLVGSAQRCERRTILQHGSILLDGEQASLVAFQMTPAAAASGGITLRSILGAVPETEAILRAIISGFEGVLGTPLAPGSLRDAERVGAEKLEEQYDSHAWTWRR